MYLVAPINQEVIFRSVRNLRGCNHIMTGKDAIRNVAQLHGTSERTVRREIKMAMDAAMKSPDPRVQRIWASIPRKGKELTVEELIEWAAAQTRM